MPYQRKPEELSVSIWLTPGLMELAKELAAEAGMPLRPFLSQALKHILVVYSGKLGRKNKYLPEATSSNTRRVRVWKQRPVASEQAEAGQAGDRAGGTGEQPPGGEGRKQKPSGSGEVRQRRGTGGGWQGEQGAEKGKKASSGSGTRRKFRRGADKRRSRPGGRRAGAGGRGGRPPAQGSEGGSAG